MKRLEFIHMYVCWHQYEQMTHTQIHAMCAHDAQSINHVYSSKRCSHTALLLQGASKPRPSQAVRIARGPDGTRGFTAALQPGNRARLLPPPPTPAHPPAQPSADGQCEMCMQIQMCCVCTRSFHLWFCNLGYTVACLCSSLRLLWKPF